MTPADAALLRLGTTEPPPVRRVLQAGALRCVLEDGAIRHATWRGVEVLRGIAWLLRDRNWGTVAARLSEPVVTESPDGFRVSFEAVVGAFRHAARIDGSADGRLEFAVTGEADAPTETNRAGFVVLHPAGFAGLTLEVTHTDGRVSHTRFPETISPAQPVLDIRALLCEPAPALRVTCTMEAELPQDASGKFEMEDQRNWSDASFKTYVGSLLDPWPYVLEPGRRFRQRVSIHIEDSATAAPATARGAVLRLGTPGVARLPAIGLGVPAGAAAADHGAIAALRPGWLVVAASLDSTPTDLAAAAALAEACGAQVQLELLLPAAAPPAQELAQAARLCAESGLRPDAVLACPQALTKSFQPSDTWPDLPPDTAFAKAARTAFPEAIIGGGMVTYFTELNRRRPDAAGLDFISHTTAPIVHAADDVSVMETLESLPAIARSVHAIWPGLAYRVGPSSLAMRSNPYGDSLTPNPDRRRIAMAGEDPRQRGLFAAAWTIGYAARLAPEGVAMLALHATHGPSGVPGEGQRALPVFHAMRALAAAGGAALIPIEQAPPGLAALAWHGPRGAAMALANTTDAALAFSLPGDWRGHVLDVPSCTDAARDPLWLDRPGAPHRALRLGPYACAFLTAEAA